MAPYENYQGKATSSHFLPHKDYYKTRKESKSYITKQGLNTKNSQCTQQQTVIQQRQKNHPLEQTTSKKT